MGEEGYQERRLTEEGVTEDLQRQPQVLIKLAENALTVAESLRNNYFKNTARFITHLRKAVHERANPISLFWKVLRKILLP